MLERSRPTLRGRWAPPSPAAAAIRTVWTTTGTTAWGKEFKISGGAPFTLFLRLLCFLVSHYSEHSLPPLILLFGTSVGEILTGIRAPVFPVVLLSR